MTSNVRELQPRDDRYEPPGPDDLPMDLYADDIPQPRLFRRWTAAELAREPDDFTWLAQGLLAQPTYGQIAGEMKTLKTYVGLFTAVGLASGTAVFGRFHVPQRRPVLAYIGEGGQRPFTRRLRRVAAACGVDLDDLDLHLSFDVAPMSSARFADSLNRDLDDIQPGLVWIDPYYAYHGAKVKASSLHEEGDLLTALSTRCLDAGASLLVANHFNQTGSGANLKRITMAGSGEWADSWILLGHRTDPDVTAGHFSLALSIGSRQWGGADYALDLTIGRFNDDTGTHEGDIEWTISRAGSAAAEREGDQYQTVIDILEEHPWQLTKQGLARELGGKADAARDLIDALHDTGQIKREEHPRREGNRLVKRWVYALADERRPDHGTELDGVA